MLGDRLDVARYLVERGCTTDILLAAAVGDLDRVRKHLDADADCIKVRASAECFPKVNPRAGGKTTSGPSAFAPRSTRPRDGAGIPK